MYTIERLAEIASSNKGGPLYYSAIHAIEHMKKMGVTEIERIGPFHAGEIKEVEKGQIVVLKSGSLVKSFNPSKKEFTLSRRHKVRVNRMDRGFVYPPEERGRNNIRETTVVWAGTGGYWCWTSIENVEAIVE